MSASVAVAEQSHGDVESERLLVPEDLKQANAHLSRWARLAAWTFALAAAGVAVRSLCSRPVLSLAWAKVSHGARKYTTRPCQSTLGVTYEHGCPQFNYNNLGTGECLSNASTAYLQCSDASAPNFDSFFCDQGFTDCAQVCNAWIECTGYAQRHPDTVECYIWTEEPVTAGGQPWGDASCMSKGSARTSSSCFPGQAEVLLKGRGRVPISSIQVGHEVLVEEGRYEAIIGFLHLFGVGKITSFLNIEHADGNLRVSANHVVFVGAAEGGRAEKIAGEVREGDELLLTSAGGRDRRSRVASVRSLTGDQGMVAPLTPKGTIVVDGALASNYATVGRLPIPHGAMHATLFFARVCAQLGLAALFAPGPMAAESMHPIVSFLHRSMHVESLIS